MISANLNVIWGMSVNNDLAGSRERGRDDRMTNADRVLAFLRSIAPKRTTIREIASNTGISPRQTVYQEAMLLMRQGVISGEMCGNAWSFRIGAAAIGQAGDTKPELKPQANRQASPPRPVGPPARSASAGDMQRPKRIATDRAPSVVIQCAGGKNPKAGCFRARGDQRVVFVARPDEAPPKPGVVYARPDDMSDDGCSTWRARLLAYNDESSEDELELLPAYQLYARQEYRDLVEAFGPDRVFILSAGWGLIRSEFLTPYYDITFSNAAPRYKKRGRSEPYADFCQLPKDNPEPILFLGGLDYQSLFENLTADVEAEKIIFHYSDAISRSNSFTYVKYETPTGRYWHYLCARDLMAGTQPVPAGRAS